MADPKVRDMDEGTTHTQVVTKDPLQSHSEEERNPSENIESQAHDHRESVPEDNGKPLHAVTVAGATSEGLHGEGETNVKSQPGDGDNRVPSKAAGDADAPAHGNSEKESDAAQESSPAAKDDVARSGEGPKGSATKLELSSVVKDPELNTAECDAIAKSSDHLFLSEADSGEGYESGTEEEQAAFRGRLESFYKERGKEFKPILFYKEELNLLKLWRAVIKLGGYEKVTSCKLWRQVGGSFRPPKTCTTVSWTFRNFYEKSLLDYEKHMMQSRVLSLPGVSITEPTVTEDQVSAGQAVGSGRVLRDAAARAMQGWHSQRLLGKREDRNSAFTPRANKQSKSIGPFKRKKPYSPDFSSQVGRMNFTKSQMGTMVIDIGPPADWVKVNVQRTNDCYEVYALIPGLLREEVHVQSDPAGRLVISGEPEELDNPWGVTPFKKVVSLPSRIDPHQTSAVVTLHGQLFVRVPFEQAEL